MLKTESLDKLEKLSKDIGIRSVLMVAWTEGYAQALRESFQKIAEVTSTWSDEELDALHFLTGQANNRKLADMEHAGISETHPMGEFD